jgi:hypothetical protein
MVLRLLGDICVADEALPNELTLFFSRVIAIAQGTSDHARYLIIFLAPSEQVTGRSWRD